MIVSECGSLRNASTAFWKLVDGTRRFSRTRARRAGAPSYQLRAARRRACRQAASPACRASARRPPAMSSRTLHRVEPRRGPCVFRLRRVCQTLHRQPACLAGERHLTDVGGVDGEKVHCDRIGVGVVGAIHHQPTRRRCRNSSMLTMAPAMELAEQRRRQASRRQPSPEYCWALPRLSARHPAVNEPIAIGAAKSVPLSAAPPTLILANGRIARPRFHFVGRRHDDIVDRRRRPRRRVAAADGGALVEGDVRGGEAAAGAVGGAADDEGRDGGRAAARRRDFDVGERDRVAAGGRAVEG